MEVSEAFINKITHLRRGGTIAGKAPHKPALLITVFQMIAKGLIQENRIYITPELVGLFKANCKLLAGISYEAEFTQPFCYLQNERIKDKPIWLLTTRENVDSFSLVKSFERFKEEVMFASFNETHFEFIKDKINAIYLVEILLETYFLDRKADFNGNDYESNDYWSLFESDLLEESEESYSKSVEKQEKRYIRSEAFKHNIPRIYEGKCSFTQLKLTSQKSMFVESCHIVPISRNGKDIIGNGIALSPSIHRAFDNGFLGIDEKYQVLVSQNFEESAPNGYGIRKLEGTIILLPRQKIHYPKMKNIEWHYENVFLK